MFAEETVRHCMLDFSNTFNAVSGP